VDIGHRTFVIADLPGLIEGAHEGAGLGHQFLRHVERTRVLIHLLNGESPDPLQDMEALDTELELFQPLLASKPQLVVLNKMDLPETQGKWPSLEAALAERGLAAMSISAATGQGVQQMLRRVVEMLDSAPEEEGQRDEVKVFRPRPVDGKEFKIKKEADGFRVRGERIERIAAQTFWDSHEAVARFQQILKALGIHRALEEAGIEVGDTVYIGDVELEWM